MFDTCLSSNGTFEIGLAVDAAELNVPARTESFNPVAMPETLSGIFGRRHFEDSIGVCTFTNTVSLATTLGVINAITGWDMDVAEAMAAGRRTGLILRAFNLRCGIGPELEFPSPEVRQCADGWSGLGELVGRGSRRRVKLDVEFEDGKTVLDFVRQLSQLYPDLGTQLWDDARHELPQPVEIAINGAILGMHHQLDSALHPGDELMLVPQYQGG